MSDKDVPNRWRQTRIVWPYFAGTHWAFVASALAAAVSSATEPVIPALMKPLFDKGFVSNEIQLWMVPAVLIGLFVVRGAAGFVSSYALSWAANKSTLRIRDAMFAKLMTAHPTLFSSHSASSLINTVVHEVNGGTGLLVSAVQSLVKDSLTAIALLGYLLWLNWRLTLLIAVLVPAVVYVMRVFSTRMHRLTLEGQRAIDDLAYVVEENILAWRIVRLHGAGETETGKFRRASLLLRRLAMKSTVATAVVTPITQVLVAVAMSGVVMAALWQSQHQSGTVGNFVAFVTSMLLLVSPLKHLSEISGPITRGLASVQRGLALIHDAPTESGGMHTVTRAAGTLSFRDVSMRYRAEQAPALDRICVDIGAGESVALVGPSGGGKSTFVNLVPRFLDPTEGQILLDGVPLAEWDLGALRQQFALVSQDVVLFNDSVAANVCLGQTLSRERVLDALKGANLLPFVEGLPLGIDSAIGHNGSELSGGQRQRLAIARAIYKDAPILLLDEATSALDTESERLVQDALAKVMAGRTSIVIAHRLSTVEAVDRVIVLDHGHVAEQGTHAELLAQGGLFSRLHGLQFKT